MAQAGELVVAVYSRSSKRASWGSLALQLPYRVLKTPQSGCYYVRFVHSPSPYQPLLPARSTLVTSHLWASRFAHPVLEFDARPHLRSRGGPSWPAPVEGIAGQPPRDWCQAGHRCDDGHSPVVGVEHAPQLLPPLVGFLPKRFALRSCTADQHRLLLALQTRQAASEAPVAAGRTRLWRQLQPSTHQPSHFESSTPPKK